MSLNFVSTSVLSSKDGISHDTETSIQPKDASAVDRTFQKPLYEQLRENAQKEQEKYDEVTKAMQGTTTLDEDDVAYIQSIEERKAEIKNNVKRKEEEEVQMFRAARLEKSMTSEIVVDDDNDELEGSKDTISQQNLDNSSSGAVTSSSASTSFMTMKPKITKKRRRRDAGTTEEAKADSSKLTTKYLKKSDESKDAADNDDDSFSKQVKSTGLENSSLKESSTDNGKNSAKVSALAGLLAYGSDSDSD